MPTKYYFRHDFFASDDEKIVELISAFGNEGYGLYWRIIEVLYRQEGRLLYSPKLLAFRFNCSEELINKILNLCIDVNLFELENTKTEAKNLVCKRVKNQLEKLNLTIEKRKVAGSIGGKKKQENKDVASKCLAKVKQTSSKRLAALSNLILSNTSNSTLEGSTKELTTNVSTKSITTKKNTNPVPIPNNNPIVDLEPIEQKIKFGELGIVELMESEVKKLEIAFKKRKDVFDRAVYLLETWKQDNPKKAAKRKSDYRQLLNWPLRQAFEDVAKIKKYSNPIASMPFVPSAAERAEIRTEMAYEKFRTTKTKSAIDKMLDGEPLDEDLETTNRRLAQ